MTDPLVYNIPARMIDAYRGRNLIIRSSLPAELADCLPRVAVSRLRFIQLLSVSADSSALEGAGENVPLEIFLGDPGQYQRLYDFTNLLDTHPVRIAIRVVPGFSKAVKLATSLNYAVKLEIEQHDEILIEEIESVLDLYLHRSYVRHPIEFFQSLLLCLYRNEPVSLWEIAEESPAQVRFITDDGEETISKRFAGVRLAVKLNKFVDTFAQELISEKRECHDCEFFSFCSGYFKWPDKAYSCAGVKRVFRTLVSASQEVREDLASYEAMGAQT